MKISLLFIQIKKVKNSNTFLTFGGRSSRIVKIQPFILIWNWRWVKSFHTFHSIQTVQEMEGFYTFLLFQFKFSSIITKFRMAFFQWKLWFKFVYFLFNKKYFFTCYQFFEWVRLYNSLFITVRTFSGTQKELIIFCHFSLCSNIYDIWWVQNATFHLKCSALR